MNSPTYDTFSGKEILIYRQPIITARFFYMNFNEWESNVVIFLDSKIHPWVVVSGDIGKNLAAGE